MLVGVVEGKLGMSAWESRIERARGVWREERNGGLELFNYSTHRQQRPRFQETITVCSPEGEAHLASFISPLLSPHNLQFGIFNVFLLLHKQTQDSVALHKWQGQLPGKWFKKKKKCFKILPLALHCKLFLSAQTSPTSGGCSYSGFQAVTHYYRIDCLNLSWKKKKKTSVGILRGDGPITLTKKGNQWKRVIDSTTSWRTDTLLAAHLTQRGLCQSGSRCEWQT